MNKINVETFFSNNKSNFHDSKSGNFDVVSISKQFDDRLFNVNNLIEARETKRRQVLSRYSEMYNLCLQKIEVANNLKKTDLLYAVKDSVPDCPEYNPSDCIDYIKTKLEDIYMDTYKIDNKTIFITWLYIEANKNNSIKKNKE